MENSVLGAEGIIIHNNKIVLGMQEKKRWYYMENGKISAIIKTIGGSLEEVDKKNTRQALIREINEELKGIDDIKISKNPIFTKKIKMKELNPYEPYSNIQMKADFYVVKITSKTKIIPNDLPALVEIPIDEFCNMNIATNFPLSNIEKYLTKKEGLKLPNDCAIMAPKEIIDFFKREEIKS